MLHPQYSQRKSRPDVISAYSVEHKLGMRVHHLHEKKLISTNEECSYNRISNKEENLVSCADVFFDTHVQYQIEHGVTGEIPVLISLTQFVKQYNLDQVYEQLNLICSILTSHAQYNIQECKTSTFDEFVAVLTPGLEPFIDQVIPKSFRQYSGSMMFAEQLFYQHFE